MEKMQTKKRKPFIDKILKIIDKEKHVRKVSLVNDDGSVYIFSKDDLEEI